MFETTRIKLTSWYLVIILIISGFFSLIIYQFVTSELEHSYIRIEERLRLNRRGELPPRARSMFFLDDLVKAKHEVAIRLVYANGVILAASAVASYFLAGISLRPLRRAMDEQKRFVGDASHELRTPIAAMKTTIEVSLRDKSISKSEVMKVLSDSLVDLNTLEGLTDSLLRISQRDELGLKFKMINNKAVSQAVVASMRSIFNKKKIKIVQNIKTVDFEADIESIEQLLSILIDNAIKYSSKGSKVALKSYKLRRSIYFEVSDTGKGVAKVERSRIFDRFYRSEKARSKSGYGLGLSLAKKIVESHGGGIKVKSKIGKGSTFVVWLPIRQNK